MRKGLLSQIVNAARVPETDRAAWAEGATDSVALLKRLMVGDEVPIYASGPHFMVHAVLVAPDALDPPDLDDLDYASIMPDDAWAIARVYASDEGHRIYLDPPLSNAGCKSLVGGEKLTFIRPSTASSIELRQSRLTKSSFTRLIFIILMSETHIVA